MNKLFILIPFFIITACAVSTPPIMTTPPNGIVTATSTPIPTSSPTPTLIPSATALPTSLQSLQLVYSGGSNPFSVYLWQAGKISTPVPNYFYLPCLPDDCNHVLLSSDGQLIIYTSQVVDYELSVVKKDGSNQKLLVDFQNIPGTQYLYGVGWIPNTHLIWFNTIDQTIYHSYVNSNDLYIVNADTGELKNILPSGEGGDIYPSPNGKYLAIVQPDRIDIRKVDGRRIPIRLDFEMPGIRSDYFPYFIPIWAKDSSSLIAVILPPEISDDKAVKLSIWKLSVTAAEPQLVSEPIVSLDMHMKLPDSSQPLSKEQAQLYPISISPDLTQFIYSRANTDGKLDFHLATLDLSSDTVVHVDNAGYDYIVDWLPDSQEFFITQREKEHWTGKGYWLGNVDGLVEPFPLDEEIIYRMDWVDDKSYIYVNKDFDLRLGIRGERESILLEKGFSPPYDTYDFLK